VHGEQREPGVVEVADGAPRPVLDHLADAKVLEIAAHGASLSGIGGEGVKPLDPTKDARYTRPRRRRVREGGAKPPLPRSCKGGRPRSQPLPLGVGRDRARTIPEPEDLPGRRQRYAFRGGRSWRDRRSSWCSSSPRPPGRPARPSSVSARSSSPRPRSASRERPRIPPPSRPSSRPPPHPPR